MLLTKNLGQSLPGQGVPRAGSAKRLRAARLPMSRRILAAASSGQDPLPALPAGDSVDDISLLKDPARIGCRATKTVRVKEKTPVSLDSYMRLPVRQYAILDPALIQFIADNKFLLLVPKISLFNLWIAPLIEVKVTQAQNPPRVILEASRARIRGSEQVENLKLDQRFCMKMTTELTWTQPSTSSASSPSASTSSGQQQQQQGITTAAAAAAVVGEGSITASSQLDVWCEVVQPFHLMPRSVLESTCNSILQLTIDTLLPIFLGRLGSDYEKW
jgi:hypothetical protein